MFTRSSLATRMARPAKADARNVLGGWVGSTFVDPKTKELKASVGPEGARRLFSIDTALKLLAAYGNVPTAKECVMFVDDFIQLVNWGYACQEAHKAGRPLPEPPKTSALIHLANEVFAESGETEIEEGDDLGDDAESSGEAAVESASVQQELPAIASAPPTSSAEARVGGGKNPLRGLRK